MKKVIFFILNAQTLTACQYTKYSQSLVALRKNDRDVLWQEYESSNRLRREYNADHRRQEREWESEERRDSGGKTQSTEDEKD